MSAPQDLWATPLAKRLVDRFRSQALTYIRITDSTYDETTGSITLTETAIPAAGAVVKSMKGERDGVQQGHEVEAWVDHITVPWPISTKDRLDYLGRRWKIIAIEPTYGSGGEAGTGELTYLATLSGDRITTLAGDPIVTDAAGVGDSFRMYASKIRARAE